MGLKGQADDEEQRLGPGDSAACAGGASSSVAFGTDAAADGESAGGFYRSGPREPVDVWWFRAIMLLGAACVAGGVAAAATADRRLFTEPGFLETPASCARPGFAPRALAEVPWPEGAPVRPATVILWLILSLVVPLVLGVVWLRLWAGHALHMVWASAGVHVACLLGGAVMMFVAGSVPGGAVMLGLAMLVAVLWGCNRRSMELCSRLLSVAAHGLRASSPGVILFSLALWALNGAVLIAAAGFALAGYANGRPRPNPEMTDAGRTLVAAGPGAAAGPSGPGTAVIYPDRCEVDGRPAPCCAWEVSGGAAVYLALLGLVTSWGVMCVGAARRFVVSSVVAQWFYAPAGAAPKGALRAAVRHAAGPQAGTVCFAGAVLAVVDALRQAANRDSRDDDNGGGGGGAVAALMCCMLRCIANLVLSVVEFLARCSLTWAALTGQGLVAAGRDVMALLKRNLLDTVTVWWMPGAVIGLTSFAFALLWGSAVFFAVTATARGAGALPAAIGVAALGALAAGVVLQFLGSLLLDASEAAFLLYAGDKDRHAATRPDVNEVFDAVAARGGKPPPGAVVQHPHGGGFAFGAAAQQQQQWQGGGGGGNVQMHTLPMQAPAPPRM